MYIDRVIDHYKNPRNKKVLKIYTAEFEDENILCGDRIKFQVLIEHNKIVDIGFTGSGCILSIASASILSEYARGKSIHEILSLSDDRFINIIGVKPGKSRINCLLLPLRVLKKAIKQLA